MSGSLLLHLPELALQPEAVHISERGPDLGDANSHSADTPRRAKLGDAAWRSWYSGCLKSESFDFAQQRWPEFPFELKQDHCTPFSPVAIDPHQHGFDNSPVAAAASNVQVMRNYQNAVTRTDGKVLLTGEEVTTLGHLQETLALPRRHREDARVTQGKRRGDVRK